MQLAALVAERQQLMRDAFDERQEKFDQTLPVAELRENCKRIQQRIVRVRNLTALITRNLTASQDFELETHRRRRSCCAIEIMLTNGRRFFEVISGDTHVSICIHGEYSGA